MSDFEHKELLSNLEEMAKKAGLDITKELEKISSKLDETKAKTQENTSQVWERVELARHSDRPRTLDYIDLIVEDFTELHGDRYYGDDPAMIGGIGFIGGMPVTVIGNQKGRNLRETIDRNGGMSNPEGYRKALRLAKQAEKFHRPIITFIDTQGAYPGLEAEERGIGEAIAVNLREFSQLETPIICIVIGEGGSGGALGIGVGDKIYMLENAIYSVISPEGCASIMLRDSSRAKDAAAMMKITSKDVLNNKMINAVLPEPVGGAHIDPVRTADTIRTCIINDLKDLMKRTPSVLVKYRNKKIRTIGHFTE